MSQEHALLPPCKRSKFRAVASPSPSPKANWARGVVASVNDGQARQGRSPRRFAYPPLLGWSLALEFSRLRVNLSPLYSLHVDSSQWPRRPSLLAVVVVLSLISAPSMF